MSTTPNQPGVQFQAFHELLKSLLPRGDRFAFFDANGTRLWSSDAAAEHELEELAKQAAGGASPTTGSVWSSETATGEVLFVQAFTGPGNVAAGYLAAAFQAAASGVPSAAMFGKLVEPAAAVLGAVLGISASHAAELASLRRTERQLSAIYSLDEKLEKSPHGQASLSHLVGAAARHLQIGYSVLLMPEKRIRIGVTHPEWKSVVRTDLDKLIVSRFFPAICERRELVVIDMKSRPPGLERDMDNYQIILCPIREGNSRVGGILTLFAQFDGLPFTANDRNFVMLVARQIERVIELNYDPSTGLMNRAGFESNVREAYGRLAEYDDEHCLIFFDIDKLQLLNDTFGHRAGDEVLMRFASELQRQLPDAGIASRISGDDFAVLLPHTDIQAGIDLAESMRLAAHKMSYVKGDKSQQITISAGVAPFRRSEEGHAGALIAPKVACTAAKDHGRDRIEVYESGQPQYRAPRRRHADCRPVAQRAQQRRISAGRSADQRSCGPRQGRNTTKCWSGCASPAGQVLKPDTFFPRRPSVTS